MWNIETKLRHDAELLSFICPRCTKVDYSKYLLDESKCLIVRQGNWPNVREVLKSSIYSAMLREILGQEAFDHYTLDSPQFIDTACGKIEYNMADESIRNFVNMFIGSLIEEYNSRLNFLFLYSLRLLIILKDVNRLLFSIVCLCRMRTLCLK